MLPLLVTPDLHDGLCFPLPIAEGMEQIHTTELKAEADAQCQTLFLFNL